MRVDDVRLLTAVPERARGHHALIANFECRSSVRRRTPAASRSARNEGPSRVLVAQRMLSKRFGSRCIAIVTATRSPPPVISGLSIRVTTRIRPFTWLFKGAVLLFRSRGGQA